MLSFDYYSISIMRLSRSRLRESITGPRLVSEGDRGRNGGRQMIMLMSREHVETYVARNDCCFHSFHGRGTTPLASQANSGLIRNVAFSN